MDRFTFASQLEHLQSKHVGTGHADTNRYEWLVNQHRDTLATFIGHAHLSTFTAIAENESIARTRFMLKKKMICPCGPPLPRGV
ncbi:Splicing factor 3B subunit 5 [Coelomomyces lativittatus]|nr:Splicing factor 3B subunit 5 [Coelomomyces lativittatus]KAJ1510939.1 Splicing factor 3B subunit 5 [Coelomomyces lativittatus]